MLELGEGAEIKCLGCLGLCFFKYTIIKCQRVVGPFVVLNFDCRLLALQILLLLCGTVV